MKKKYLALAIASLASAPFALAQSNVTIYGKMNLGFDRYKAEGATAGSAFDLDSRSRLMDNSSRIGFRGTEDLGNGLKALFQIESGFNADASAGAVGASTGTLGSRPTFVGLQGNWGTVLVGRQDVYYGNGKLDEPNRLGLMPNAFENAAAGRNAITADGSLLAGGRDGRMTGALARTDNVLTYVTPSYSGFNGKIQYAIPTGEATPAGSSVKDSAWALNLTYDNGPWYAQVDWMRREDTILAWDGSAAATANGNKVEAWKIGLAYAFPTDTHLGFVWEELKNTTGNGALLLANTTNPERKRTSWALNVVQGFGNAKAYLKYGRLDDVEGAVGGGTDTSARQWALGLSYSLSKRTALNAFYTKISNDRNADYQFIAYNGGAGGSNTTPAAALGADPTAFGVGLVHSF
ncbi:MAG: Outer membrane porin protein [Rhodocyclaceae bacterium]|nr:Outer membrane porin protein [Rhodocyclaceae bacterium]